MSIESQLKQDLRSVRALFKEPWNWQQGSMAKNAEGRSTFAYSDDAVCWCLSGAIMRLSDGDGERRVLCMEMLFNYTKPSNIPTWNDAPHRTFEDVIALLDKAIEDTP